MYEANLAAQRVLREAQQRKGHSMALLAPAIGSSIRTGELVLRPAAGLIDEGMSRKEIAGGWGFSLPVVSSVANSEVPVSPIRVPRRVAIHLHFPSARRQSDRT